MTRTEQRLAAANVTVALVALFGGVVTGLFQALEYAGVEIYSSLAPVIRSHYHSVSIHGVLNALGLATNRISAPMAGPLTPEDRCGSDSATRPATRPVRPRPLPAACLRPASGGGRVRV